MDSVELGYGTRGDAVALLHGELAVLGVEVPADEVPADEVRAARFGPGTALALATLRQRLDPAGTVGAVDAGLARLIDAELDRSGTAGVYGTVTGADGTAVPGATVRLLGRHPGGPEQELGRGTDGPGRAVHAALRARRRDPGPPRHPGRDTGGCRNTRGFQSTGGCCWDTGG